VRALVGIIRTAVYVTKKRDESVYKPKRCSVKNYTFFGKICRSKFCDGSENSQICSKSYCLCNEEFYTVIYNVCNGRTIETAFEASDGPGPDSVGTLVEVTIKS
jgi:hypothetical protein